MSVMQIVFFQRRRGGHFGAGFAGEGVPVMVEFEVVVRLRDKCRTFVIAGGWALVGGGCT